MPKEVYTQKDGRDILTLCRAVATNVTRRLGWADEFKGDMAAAAALKVLQQVTKAGGLPTGYCHRIAQQEAYKEAYEGWGSRYKTISGKNGKRRQRRVRREYVNYDDVSEAWKGTTPSCEQRVLQRLTLEKLAR